VNATTTFDPSTIDVNGAVTLVIAKRSGKNLKGYRIAMHNDVANELRSVCAESLASLRSRAAIGYADDLSYDADTQYVLVPSGVLVAHKPESRRGRKASDAPAEPKLIEVDASARQVLASASSLPQLSSADLKNQTFVFYAAVVGNDPQHRTAFLDKWNPYKAGLSGNILTSFGDRLRRIEGPVLTFRRSFDMVVTDNAIAVLNLTAFEEVFRDIDSMVARIPVWRDAAIKTLPFDDATVTRLTELSDKGGRFAKQLRGLYERGVLQQTFDLTELRQEMKAQDLDDGRLIADDKLVLEDDDILLSSSLSTRSCTKAGRPGRRGTSALVPNDRPELGALCSDASSHQ
jgi:hypothetical protein